MRTWWICAVACALAPSLARAGYCLSEDEREDETKRLEAMAKKPASAERSGAESSLVQCVLRGSAADPHTAAADAKYRARAIEACKKLVVTKPTDITTPVIASCTDLLVSGGTVVVDKTDLLEQVMKRPAGPFDPTSFETMARSKDSRVRAYVIEKVRAALAKMAKYTPHGWQAQAWQAFRKDALAALALVGTSDDSALQDALRAQ